MSVEFLLEPTLALTFAVVAVLLLRPLVRPWLGAATTYGLWAIVPAAIVAVLLPASSEPVLPQVLVSAVGMSVSAPETRASVSPSLAPLLLFVAWVAGAAFTLCLMGWQQRSFLLALGPLSRRPDGLHQCLATRGLPAVVGLNPKIILPGDFERRYSPLEQELLLAHEKQHLRRGDLVVCALAAALRSIFWFNPAVHLALPRFRQDQEAACDAAVLQRFPEHRRSYAEAMLKTDLAGQPLPLGCHWTGPHPLKERLAMLKKPLPSRRRRLLGAVFGSLLGVAAAALAWAAQPSQPGELPEGKLRLGMVVSVDGQIAKSSQAIVAPGQDHSERFTHGEETWNLTWNVRPLGNGTFDIQGRILRGTEVIGEPRMIARDDAAIRIGESGPDGSFEGIAVDLSVQSGPKPGTAGRSNGLAESGIQGDAPVYPKSSADAGEGGKVVLKVLVGTDGRAKDIEFAPEESTVAADSALVASARDAAATWTFNPQRKDGEAVEAWVMVPVTFEPPAKPSPEA